MLRNMVSSKNQTLALRRLIRDLKEIEANEVPTVGVTARPLENDFFTWHGNVRGPEGTPYQGAVFHIELHFDEVYPHTPPQVKVFTSVPHPNIFGFGICLDMLDPTTRVLYQGWTSAYTVQSVLLQLQSFFFEEMMDPEKSLPEIKMAVKRANEFVCQHPDCKHKGPLSPWPAFSNREGNLNNYVLKRTHE